jgi:multidrug efflux system membrane fusion protein
MAAHASVRRALGAMLLVSVVGGGCSRRSSTVASNDAPWVRVAHPIVREVTEYYYFTGRTEAPETVDLQSRVTGYLDAIEFTPGDEAPAGKELFKIDPRPYQAQLDIANSQVKLAEARLKLAEADYRRAVELLKTPGVISQQDVDKYVAAQTEAAASVAAAQANADAAKLNLEFTSIVSPINGVVGRNYPSVGALIRQDDTLLTTIVSQTPMYAYFDVDEQSMLRVGRLINAGKIKSKESGAIIPVEMALADEDDEYPHVGEVDFINNRVSPTTGTLEIRGVFDNPLLADGKRRFFRPGMFVRIRVPVGDPADALLLPQAAIGTDQGRKYVLVVNDQDVVEQRVVDLGPQQPGGLQVVVPTKVKSSADASQTGAGLAAGDRVIVGGLQLVRPGTKVRVRETPASAAPTAGSSARRARTVDSPV